MARLVPSVQGRAFASAAEQKLAERFRKETPDSWVLMHSVGFIRHVSKRWAEADFVLINQFGAMCLEVKGGRVACVDGVWRFTNRSGRTSEKHEGPFDQAGGAAGALQAWLADHAVRRTDGKRFQVGYGVMTPDCVLDVESPSIDRDVLFDQRNDSAGLADWAEGIGRYWADRQKSAPLTPMEVDLLVERIRPTFDAYSNPSFEVGRLSESLIRLTEQQGELLASVAENDRLIVSGSAGTGKTMLALLEAERLAQRGSVLLSCFSQQLADHLSQCAQHANIQVKSVDRLSREIIDSCSAGDQLPDAEDAFLASTFRPALAAKLLSNRPDLRFDAVVLDETQDLRTVEFTGLIDAVQRRGLSGGTWRMFQDPNQNLFGKAEPAALELISSGQPAKFKLSRNCRNTKQVVATVEMLAAAEITAPASIDGPHVVLCDRWTQPPIDRALSILGEWRGMGIVDSDIAVLTVKPSAAKRAASQVMKVAAGVSVSSVDDFKGLDRPAIVLLTDTELDSPEHRKAMYVGLTRAKIRLAVIIPKGGEPAYRRLLQEFVARLTSETEE